MLNRPTINRVKKGCYFCGCPLTPSNRTIDHLIPLARGGRNIRTNRVWCCSKCNKEKMDMTEKEYSVYRKLKEKCHTRRELIEECRKHKIYLETEERKKRNELERMRRKTNGY